MEQTKDKIRYDHLKYAKIRGNKCTYCASEVAREIFPENWRKEMESVRRVADELVLVGELKVLQKMFYKIFCLHN